ncbi:hypothetical protein CJ030_MR0G013667 [Morella rubra]|uniref:Uncharacterized protein n=1 Tax=Morella rubra TaxID=262757 RepID=A0A6A1UH50_9ROSI|nr:hypothetical protein CJ030_MR0G013667 [Morella rubra]
MKIFLGLKPEAITIKILAGVSLPHYAEKDMQTTWNFKMAISKGNAIRNSISLFVFRKMQMGMKFILESQQEIVAWSNRDDSAILPVGISNLDEAKVGSHKHAILQIIIHQKKLIPFTLLRLCAQMVSLLLS